MTKWENNFIEEDIDLHVFLTLDDDDLKKIGNHFFTKLVFYNLLQGIKLFGPRRKMTTQIARIIDEMEPTIPAKEQDWFFKNHYLVRIRVKILDLKLMKKFVSRIFLDIKILVMES